MKFRKKFGLTIQNALCHFRMLNRGWRYNKNISKFFRLVIPQPPQKFLVICNARTGSNYLLTALDSHPLIRHYWEPFGPNSLNHKVGVKEKILELGLVPYLEHLLRRQGGEAIAGFKILYGQLEDSYGENHGLPDIANVREFLKQSNRLKVIHLKRRNKLATIASLLLAIETRRFLIHDPKDRETKRQLHIPIESCTWNIKKIIQYEKQFDEFFAEHIKIDVFYEELVAEPDRVGSQILEFLDVPDRRLHSRLIKQNIRPLTEVIANYAKLKAHFADTLWANYFTE